MKMTTTTFLVLLDTLTTIRSENVSVASATETGTDELVNRTIGFLCDHLDAAQS